MNTDHEQIPSDEDVLAAVSTFENGCDFTLRFTDDRVLLGYGCYGVHWNLVQGARWTVSRWLGRNGSAKEIALRPETIRALKARPPCQRCGGFTFQPLPPAALPAPQHGRPEVDLKAIRQREQAASEGPWRVRAENGCACRALQGGQQAYGPEYIGCLCTTTDGNREFIAHARSDIPALLAEVDRLRALPTFAPGRPAQEEPKQGNDYIAGAALLSGCSWSCHLKHLGMDYRAHCSSCQRIADAIATAVNLDRALLKAASPSPSQLETAARELLAGVERTADHTQWFDAIAKLKNALDHGASPSQEGPTIAFVVLKALANRVTCNEHAMGVLCEPCRNEGNGCLRLWARNGEWPADFNPKGDPTC